MGPQVRCPRPLKRGARLIEVILLVFYKRNDWDLSLVSVEKGGVRLKGVAAIRGSTVIPTIPKIIPTIPTIIPFSVKLLNP